MPFQPITLDQLPEDLLFEGYYWYSHEEKPHVVRNEPLQQAWFADLPFVIEANFFCREAQLSVQVRHLNGAYQFTQLDLKSLPGQQWNPLTYQAHDLEDVAAFEVAEVWREVSDPLLEGMKTLQPAGTAFIGFVHPKSHAS
jgi:CRISPR type III-associated protein (TIGR04423 family)